MQSETETLSESAGSVTRGLTGAPRTRYFNDTELERLAKYQMVTLEKVRVLLGQLR